MTRRYLVVDDNRPFAENVAEILTDSGAEVSLELAGGAAMERLRHTRFDGIVTDMRMGDCSGAELLRRVRSVDPGVPVVVLSAYARDAEVDEARRYGLFAFLSKPGGATRLLELLPKARRDATVLLVEDDVALSDNLEEVLTAHGFTVCASHSLSELDAVQVKPAVAVVDLRIPSEADGASLARVRERFPGVPVVVMSGLPEDALRIDGVERFSKPCSLERLVSRLEALTGPEAGGR